MKFKMSTASRKRLEELLTFLGDRAEDFKKCFDVESEWCWKYAAIVLRGVNDKRKFPYREGHHIVPASFYGKRNKSVNEGNLISLPYGEHLFAHYCAAQCGIGKNAGKMASAFCTMYRIGMAGKRPMLPSEAELIAAIPEMEVRRIQGMDPRWSKLELECRTHRSDDPATYYREWVENNKEHVKTYKKNYYEEHKEELSDQWKEAYPEKRDKILKQHKEAYRKDPEKILKRNKKWRDAHPEKIREYKKTYYANNKDKIAERKLKYRLENPEKVKAIKHACYMRRRDDVLVRNKVWRDAHPEKMREYKTKWAKNNLDKKRDSARAYCAKKRAAGYRYRKDKITGKSGWVFVGLPETPGASTAAA